MKNILLLLIFVSSLISCGSNDDKKSGKETKMESDKKETVNDLSQNPDYQKGLALVSKPEYLCLTCHKIDEKLTGPAYRDVANKYAGMPDTIVTHLAKKIISGGNGVWGEIFMTPHPTLSQADAEVMVKYILLLKK
jgi:cytochrome c